MDQIDRSILNELEKDGRISYGELGDRVGLSKTPCWNRVRQLADQQVITGYKAVLDHKALGLDIVAFLQVSVAFAEHEEFEDAVRAHTFIRSCHALIGEADYMLHILASDINHLDHLLRKELWKLPGVEKFITTVSTNVIKEDAPLMDMVDAP